MFLRNHRAAIKCEKKKGVSIATYANAFYDHGFDVGSHTRDGAIGRRDGE
jgi:hypothetical protein